MANYANLKATIDANIKANGTEAITGPVLNSVLTAAVNTLGAGYQFMGVATTSTSPGTPDANVFYIAATPGTYTNFGGLTVADGEVAILKYNGSWTKEVTGAATAAQLTQLGQEVDELASEVNGATSPFYPNWAITGKYLNASGVPTSATNWAISAPIPLKKGEKITINTQGGAFCVIAQTDSLGTSYTPLVLVPGSASGNNPYSYTASQDCYVALSGKIGLGDVTCSHSIGNNLNARLNNISEESANLVLLQNATNSFQGTTVETSITGRIKVTGTADQSGGRTVKQCMPFLLPAGSYRLVLSNTPSVLLYLENEVGNAIIVTGAGTFTLSAATNVYIGLNTSSGTVYNDEFGVAIYSDQNKTEYLPTITAEDSIARAKAKKNEDDIAIIGPKADNALQQVTGLSPIANTKVFTQLESANKVIRHLYIDASNYDGQYSTDGLKIKGLFNDGTETSQISLANASGDTLAYHAYGPNVPVHEWTENGIYLYAELNWGNMPEGDDRITNIALTSEVYKPYNNPNKSEEHIFSGFILGAAGDSITNSAGYPIDNDSDPFNPITGNKNKSWAYFIAKHYNMQWHNYGDSGSTLGDCIVANYNQRGFSKADGRYTQMADNLTHITIWFGWNDMYYGPRMQKQMWVQATYGNSHWYPPNNDASFIGQPGYVTQEEYDAVNAVTGEVGGVQYNDSQEYWKAVYVGTPGDATNKTFLGAWNIVLPYLINKYPYAKILLISPYGTNELMRQAVRDAAFKFGLQYYDFGKDQNQMFAHGWQDESEQGRIGSISVEQFRTNTLLSDGTHPNLQGNMYLYPSIGAKLMAL